MNKRLLFIAQVEKRVGRHRVTLDRWWNQGKFPRPTLIEGRNAWYESEIDQWIDFKMTAEQ